MPDNSKTLAVESAVENISIADVEGDDDFVDPWNVASTSDTGVDYDKLISNYN